METLELKIDLAALNHLGLNLYSNVPAVLSELIANSWDADASKVILDVKDENGKKSITVSDDGCGMDKEDLQNKFLTVGYQRRKSEHSDTTPSGRKVMGRKGIGKLSVFSIAENVQIYSRKNGMTSGLHLIYSDIQNDIESGNQHHLPLIEDIAPENDIEGSGTIVVLTDIKKRVYSSLDDNLKKRVARRFNIWSDEFSVLINRQPVTYKDREYLHKLEYVLLYGEQHDESMFPHLEDVYLKERPNKIGSDTGYKVNGWVGLVKNSGSLQNDNENINRLAILMRGKVALENILDSFGEQGLYTKYLIGELDADFLDLTEQDDIATSSRQDFLQTDQRFVDLSDFIRAELKFIEKERKRYKQEVGVEKAKEIPEIKEWLEELTGDAKNVAEKLFGRINAIAVDEVHRKTLYKHGVLAFESLHHREKLLQLEKIDIENLEVAVQLFSELDEIEASWYYEITKGRLNVIHLLSKHVDDNALEKVIQEHIYNHLWLLDPSWDRATETPTLESTVKKEFDKISKKLTKKEKNARIDIRYKKTSGKHIIVELKRASVRVRTTELIDQVEKYIDALEKQIELNDDLGPIEVICLVGAKLTDWNTNKKEEISKDILAVKNIRIVTYQQLITEAEVSYQNYLEKSKRRNKIEKLLEAIEKF